MNKEYCTVRAQPELHHAPLLAASRQRQCMRQMLGQELSHAECDVGEVLSAVQQDSFHIYRAAAGRLH